MRPFIKTLMFGTPVLTVEWLASLVRTLATAFRDISEMPFNRSSEVTVADTGTADVEFSANHYLGRVPAGFLVTKTNKAAVVYNSGTAWNTTTIYLKCNAANANVTLRVF